MRALTIIGLAALASLSAAVPARGDLLVNGGFEAPALPSGMFMVITPGAEPAGFAWRVSGGSVDVGHGPISPFIEYPAFEGNQSLDLNGNERGALFQDFATTAGQAYTLSFAYADNPLEGGISTASIAVTDVGTGTSLLSGSVAHSTSTNGPPANADWRQFLGSFTAVGATTRLAFASTSASNTPSGGIVLDAVRVEPVAVPEPSSVLLMGVGALGLLGRGLRRRRAARA